MRRVMFIVMLMVGIAFSGTAIAAEKKNTNFREDLVLHEFWYSIVERDGRYVGEWTVPITNISDIRYKDIVLILAYYGASGTRITHRSYIEYIIIQPGETIKIKFDCINSLIEQADYTKMWIHKATKFDY